MKNLKENAVAYIYVILMVAALAAACSSCKPVPTVVKETHDSTITDTVVRHDTVNIKGDTVTIKEMIECDKVTNKPEPFKSKATNGRAKASAELDKNGNLTIKCKADSLQAIIDAFDKTTQHFRTEKETVTKVEKYIPVIYKVGFWWMIACAVLFIIWIIWGRK